MSEYTTCCICGEDKPFSFEPYHGSCHRKWCEEESGEPQVAGVIVSEKTTPQEMSDAIEKSVKEAPRFANIVVRC